MHTRDYRLLHIYFHVAQAGSVTRAAERLHLSPPVVSQALGDLEDRLGSTLVIRGPRQFRLTETGEAVRAHARRMLEAADAALASGGATGRREPLTGRVRITLAVELAMHWLPPILTRFATEHPDLLVDVDADDRRVALDRSDVEVAVRAVRATADEPVEADAERLGPVPLVLAGVTALARKRPLPLIALSWQHEAIEAGRLVDDSGQAIDVRAVQVVNNSLVAHQLCLKGMGAALLLEPTVHDDLAIGTLQRLRRRHHFGDVALSLSFRDPLPSPRARALAGCIRSHTTAVSDSLGAASGRDS